MSLLKLSVTLMIGIFVADGLRLNQEHSQKELPKSTRDLVCVGAPENEAYSCPNRTDGFGEQYLCQMLALALARTCGGCYSFGGFDHDFVSNYTESGRSSEDFDAETFSGLKSDPGCKSNDNVFAAEHQMFALPNYLRDNNIPIDNPNMPGVSGAVQAMFLPEIRAELKAAYWSNKEKMPVARDTECEVAFHDRRGDALDRNTAFDVIRDAIDRHFADKKVCLISQGAEEDFEPIRDMIEGGKVKLLLEGTAAETFHNFVTAPELVVGHSAFSYAAGLITDGKVYHLPHLAECKFGCGGSFDGYELDDWTAINPNPFVARTQRPTVVFFAGIEGSGHHLMEALLPHLEYHPVNFTVKRNSIAPTWGCGVKWDYADYQNFTDQLKALDPGSVHVLPTIMSYPMCAAMKVFPNGTVREADHKNRMTNFHPRLDWILKAARTAKVFLHVVQLHRPVDDCLAANCLHRQFEKCDQETEIMIANGGYLASHLSQLLPNEHSCLRYGNETDMAHEVNAVWGADGDKVIAENFQQSPPQHMRDNEPGWSGYMSKLQALSDTLGRYCDQAPQLTLNKIATPTETFFHKIIDRTNWKV